MNQTAEIDWCDEGVPVSRRFDDPYFSIDGGLAETGHVFIKGNQLPERFAPGFHIAELGFGTGLNMLSAWDVWDRSGTSGALRFTSFEAYPMTGDQMAKALGSFPIFTKMATQFLDIWPGDNGEITLPGLEFTLVRGDARLTLPAWTGSADAWFLDGFSPAKNPELWGVELMQQVARHTRPNGTFATYTAAGHVRRSLQSAGFDVARVPGYGRKRHMSVGALRTK